MPMDVDKVDMSVPLSKTPARVIGGTRKPSPRLKSKWTTTRRLAIVQKYRNLMGVKPAQPTSHFTRREKCLQLLLHVKKFNEDEARKFEKETENNEELKKSVNDFLKVPLGKAVDRTVAMTGCSKRSLQRFCAQDNKQELTPKLKPGRPKFDCPDWILTDIRIIVTGKFYE